MEIISYPHPTLRHKSKTVRRVDQELRDIVAEMFELMYEANGIGLAANQVDLPLRLFVINTTADPEKGEELVFINPVIDSPKGTDEKEEGCLSLVSIHGYVARPEQIHVTAYDLTGNEIDMTVGGLLARAIQHENDHLDGVLFIDRISESAQRMIQAELEDFEMEHHGLQASSKIPSDEAIAKRLAEIEQRYC